MRIVEINAGNIGSTGNIMLGIAEKAKLNGNEVMVCYPNARGNRKKVVKEQLLIGDRFSRNFHLKCAELTGFNGCFSFFSTKKFIKTVSKYKPDIIHLHNLHNCYINLPILFNYIKKHNIPVVWTLHDSWAFTGHCPFFSMAKCDKWKTGCCNCPSYRDYPKSFFDNSKKMYRLKKKWFTGIENLTIVTPSEWLAGLVKQSFLKDYPVKVIHNGIDLSFFKPTKIDFRKKFHIPDDKYILLGVAFGWGIRKGFDVFIELQKRLDKKKYQIVLVGSDDNVDKQLPKEIISIHRTQNQTELAEIYTAADLFVNPTREEVLGLVNIEANACGTPVITFRTGGSPECINEKSGMVVDCDDVDAMQNGIEEICENHVFSSEDCIAQAQSFDMNKRFQDYIDLFQEVEEHKG